ncbi:MAG: hypothetical protein ABJE66_08320 [Deltaproteobacteria bacterium]
MWRTVLVALALLGCVDPGKGARWPGHRKDHDARLDKLATQLDAEPQQLAALSQRIAELEHQLSHVQPAAQVPPPVPAPPAPAASVPAAAVPDTLK